MVRYIDFEMIDDIALGASILGTGGGGDPYLGSLIAKNALRHGKPVTLCNLDDVKDNEALYPVQYDGCADGFRRKNHFTAANSLGI